MKKYLQIIILFFAIGITTKAQNVEKSKEKLSKAAENADLIIKGQIIKRYCFTAKGVSSNYNTAFVIKIEKVLKGSYLGNYIETYNEGGIIGNVKIESPHGLKEIDCETGSGYFCLFKNKIEKILTPDTLTNLPIYQPLAAICMGYEISKETKKRDLWSGHYREIYLNSEEQIYQALNLIYNSPKELKKKEKSVLEKQNENKLKSSKFHDIQKQFYSKKDNFTTSKQLALSDPQGCKEPFFSEFFNGTNLNKALEIFNPKATSIDLSNFVIKAGLVGQSALITITLNGTIPPKGTYVISNVSANSDILQIANQIISDSVLVNTVQITLEDNQGNVYDKIGSTQLIEWITYTLPFYATHSFRRNYNTSHGEENWVVAQSTWNAIPQNDFSDIHRHVNICSPLVNNINFEFDNFILSNSSGSDYVEFDIMASSNVNTYIQNAPFYIQYDNTAFGTYIVMDGNITVTKGSAFGSSYENPQTSMFDSLMNMFVVGITDDFNASSWNRPLVNSTPIQVLHFKIKILNCDQTVDFNFVEQQVTSFVTLGVPTATEDLITGSFYFYDNVTYTNLTAAIIPECLIYISQINNSTSTIHVIAGDINDQNSILNIQGGHFGAVQGTGKMYMKNADDAGATWLELDSYDLTWSDNLITAKVPSCKINGDKLIAGSGQIKIINSNSDSVISNQNVIVDYSLINYKTSTTNVFKNRLVLAALDSADNKILFKLNTNVANNAPIKGCVAKAIKDWRCSTTVNWFLDTLTTNVDTATYDEISVIRFSYNLPYDVLARATPIQIYCDQTNNSVGYVSEIDVEINANRLNDFQSDTTFLTSIVSGKYDLYEVILHEFGHGCLLNHTNQTNSIMYPFSNQGPINTNQRKTFIDFDNIDGGINVVIKSNNTTNFLCTGVQTMSSQSGGNCVGTSGTRYITDNSNNSLNIFPNPTNDFLNINYSLTSKGKTQLQIINSIGQVVREYSNQQLEGTHTITVDTKIFSKGIYYIRFSDGVNSKQAKVVIQ